MDIEIKQQDSHNLISVHHIASDNNIGNVAAAGNAVGGSTDRVDNLSLDHTIGQAGETVETVLPTAGEVVGQVHGIVANVPVADVVAGEVGSIASEVPVVSDVADDLPIYDPEIGTSVDDAAFAVPAAHDLTGEDVTGALLTPAELPVAGPIAGEDAIQQVTGGSAAALPVDGLF
ncbi:hypothetical protein MOQ72_39065 [Saccharopolyspora sp. K220]|uniref:hypothetical protein n=1 Tax=Saccharopolyspora soli TaxID=2926618 RepID=UPI001F55BAE1|nr:hypothetical protein [Saccharopolyspora soli]MCI2423431.1 hypothetical protein [Saccharopolyspora soli]